MKNKQRGSVLLIELLFAMLIITTLMSMTATGFVKLHRARNQSDAVTRLVEVRQAQAALTICANTPTCVPSQTLQNLIPVDGSIQTTGGYTFTYHYNAGLWFMSADPVSSISGVRWLYIDYTTVLRASDSGPANASSAAW